MKRLIKYILTFSLIYSCQKTLIKKEESGYNNPTIQSLSLVSLIKDTTIDGIWDGGGKEFTLDEHHNYRIHGKGVFQNWDINCSHNRVIFDTSIVIRNIKSSDGIFSTKWYGISGRNQDNWNIIQKSIDICKANRLTCFTPGLETYNFSKPLDFSTIISGQYVQSFNDFEGDANYWDNGTGTRFNYTGKTSPAFIIQLQKGSIFKNFVLTGLYKCPVGTDSTYYSLTEAQYTDQSGNNLSNDYTGFGIDYFYDGKSRSGSTGINVSNISIGGFATAIGFSQNGYTANNDAHTFDYIHFLDNKYCIVECNAQEKGTSVNHIYSWGSCYNVINQGLHGAHQAGNYSYHTANIAGRCIEPVNASIGHWFSSSFYDWYCESIGRVITFSGQMPFTFYNCNFNLSTYNKSRIVINSNTAYLTMHGCTIRYYDGMTNNIFAHGYYTIAGYPDNYFGGGTIINK